MAEPMIACTFMSAALRQFYQNEWLREMRAHVKDGRFQLLPSEAAKIVGERWSVSPATIMLAFAPVRPGGGNG